MRVLLKLLFSLLIPVLVCSSAVFSAASVRPGAFEFETSGPARHLIVDKPVNGGIIEDIPAKYLERYKKWKDAVLSTDFGREQWQNYADRKDFILTIKIDETRGQGAGTDQYLWDTAGNFVGATISLGPKLDKGFPSPIYYPVMNSLDSNEDDYSIDRNVLAGTKFIHEIGHVNQTFDVNRDLFRLQDQLMPVYISIFLKNGYNTRDQKLVNLAQQMGGTPVKIWENREYWSEVDSMRYLNEKIQGEIFYCNVVSKIKRNIELYAKNYEDRFDKVTEGKSVSAVCGK